MTRCALIVVLIAIAAGTAFAQPAEPEPERPFLAAVRVAMDAEARSDAERERDANRLPVETLDFLGLDETMTVVELIPGAGWYTRLLAPALREQGKLYVSIAAGRVAQSGLLDEPPFDRVEVLEPELEIVPDEDSGLVAIKPFDLGVQNVDAVLTFRNLHNLNAEGRDSMNRAAFEALRPGGVYGVVDHTRRHMEADGPENRRRVDPVQMIMEIQAAGFEFEDYSDLHYRADDELRYEVGRKSVTGNSDRFTFLFRKPGAD
ncbi:MAG: hypothetical protein RQ741_05685 [Wenzhouxiangellaceae bacterium]|nr:hypothetical protein [Wenzhouxiangellaceae bacterium]